MNDLKTPTANPKLFGRIGAYADKVTTTLYPLAPLAARLTLGIMFVGTGWGKLQHLDKITAYFTDLHIPAPYYQARLVAAVEFLGGISLVIGFLTRLAAAPLAGTMVVALLTAKHDDIKSFDDLVGAAEYLYLLLLFWLALAGGGPLSIDGLIRRFAAKKK